MNKREQIANISIEDYNYELPEERIAKYPLAERDQSKLLFWEKGNIIDEQFTNIHRFLPPASLLVFNNTKVVRARLHFTKETGSKIEIFLLDPFEPADYSHNFQQTTSCSWNCIVGNLKKWKNGALILPVSIDNKKVDLKAERIGQNVNGCLISFNWNNNSFSFAEILEAAGNLPIPPYLNRESETIDDSRYQTVYSKIKGSVAAPTAGLHFTEKVFDSLKINGISIAELTLHVGAGTFQPVKAEKINGHEMHTEHILVERSFIETLFNHKNPVIAVGTTSIRTLESLYWMGLKVLSYPNIKPEELKTDQWEPYCNEKLVSKEDALCALLGYMDKNELDQIDSSTKIIIVPGYKFMVIDGMITNFHQPKSTLLLLISAFVGSDWLRIYRHALENNYRFLSYGDSNLYLA